MDKLKDLIYKVNVPRILANHIVGKDHTPNHRMKIGACVALLGVVMAHTAGGFALPIAIVGDFLGYTIHGVGLIPLFEHIGDGSKNDEKCSR